MMKSLRWRSKEYVVGPKGLGRRALKTLSVPEHEALNLQTIEAKLGPWMRNLKANISAIEQAEKQNMLEIPLSSGPSVAVGGSNPKTPLLAKNIHHLQDFQGRIYACDRAVPRLMAADARPDVIVYIESNRDPHLEWVMKGLDQPPQRPKPELWCMPMVHPDVPRAYREAHGIVRWFHVQYPENVENLDLFVRCILPEMYLFWTGGNVGLCTWYAAFCRGNNPVGLVGYDFSEQLDDGSLKTTNLMQSWASTLAMGIQSVSQDVRTIDCTEGGLLTSSGKVDSMTLQEFVRLYHG